MTKNPTSIDNWDNFKGLLRGAEPLEEKTIWIIFRNMARTAHELVSFSLILIQSTYLLIQNSKTM